MNRSKINWTETTWSPVIGCTKVSAGCKHCYAEREVETRWSKNPKSIWFGRRFGDVLCRPEVLTGPPSPLTWKRPRRIFVCPRADLFHEAVPVEFIEQVFAVMAACPQHTFQILTKRAARMQFVLWSELDWKPLPNVWLGVSVEDQATANERIPILLQTPAAVRWLSVEPMIGPVDLDRGGWPFLRALIPPQGNKTGWSRGVDWVVAGGESGPNARPMHPDWARGLRDQCEAAGVPFLFKQWGEYCPSSYLPKDTALPARSWAWISEKGGPAEINHFGPFKDEFAHHELMARLGVRKAGRLLDGVLHDAYPEVPRW